VTMTGRERVLAAINHEEPDRVPIVIGASNATGLKAGPYRGLKQLLGVTSEDRYIYDWPELGTILPDEAVLERLHADVRGVFDSFPAATLARNVARPAHSPFIDDWGSGQVEVEAGTWYPGVHPMAEATTIEAIERYPWPDMDDPSRVADVHAAAARLAADNQYAILATPWLLFPFERAFAMQGLETFLMNLALEPEFAEALLWKIAERCKALIGHFLDALGDDVDMIKIGDDLGTEQSLLMSPAMYRRILKPIHADYIAFIKSRTKAKVFFHTDGDVFDLLDDLVEIGVDILNPVQSGSGKLGNLAEVKRRYGSRLAFCGAIDTQHVLPMGTPAEVRAEVRRAIATLGPGGGYLLSAVHTVMNEVPAENVLAMVDAALEFGRYPLASL
jgi:uroporphyrinogen decarboxylase